MNTPFLKVDSIINQAYRFAKKKHMGQRYGESTFMYHPIQVAKIIRLLSPEDINLIAAAFLHDMLEETNTTYQDLVSLFNKDIADLVKEVTKSDYNNFPSLHTPRGVLLKFADRTANLSNIHLWPDEKQKKYIEKSKFWKE